MTKSPLQAKCINQSASSHQVWVSGLGGSNLPQVAVTWLCQGPGTAVTMRGPIASRSVQSGGDSDLSSEVAVVLTSHVEHIYCISHLSSDLGPNR